MTKAPFLLCGFFFLAGCAGGGDVEPEPEGPVSCSGDRDCQAGEICSDDVCVDWSDDEPEPTPTPEPESTCSADMQAAADENDTECDHDWFIDETIDPITDARELKFFRFAEESYTNWVGQTEFPFIMVICAEGRALLVFRVGTVDRNIDDVTDVTIRLGSNDPIDTQAIADSDFIFFTTEEAEQFARGAFDEDQVVLRFDPFELVSATSIFDTTMLEEVIGGESATCGFF